jgi:hypothetical protein
LSCAARLATTGSRTSDPPNGVKKKSPTKQNPRQNAADDEILQEYEFSSA